jgi:hypothetical protein
MAEVGAVYDCAAAPGTAGDILASGQDAPQRAAGPKARSKWLLASVVDAAAAVVARIFEQAARRDPAGRRRWVALVDGNNQQIDRITTQAARRGVNVAIVVDLIHVLEYLWKAAWCFFTEGDPAARDWLLRPDSGPIGAQQQGRRSDPRQGHPRRPAARSAQERRHLREVSAQQASLPGLSDRAGGRLADLHRRDPGCLPPPRQRPHGPHRRPLGVHGAEAILRLRALHSNGDFEAYWTYHLAQEKRPTHQARYANGVIPAA